MNVSEIISVLQILEITVRLRHIIGYAEAQTNSSRRIRFVQWGGLFLQVSGYLWQERIHVLSCRATAACSCMGLRFRLPRDTKEISCILCLIIPIMARPISIINAILKK